MNDVIPDPDFEGFDGRFVDDTVPTDFPDYDYTKMLAYMREHNKELSDMTEEEIRLFLCE